MLRSRWKSEKASRAGELSHNSYPLGGGVAEDDGMESDNRSARLGKGALEELMRERIQSSIESIVDEELEAALGAARSQRVGQVRVGYRHGKRKWKLRCKTVSASFEEAADQLFTFAAFPISQWKALRTTNALERINQEFRRRTTTQASLPSEEAVLRLLFGLLRSGQVTLRRLVGWQDLTTVSEQPEAA